MLLEIMIYLHHDLASVHGKVQSTVKYSLLKSGNSLGWLETHVAMTVRQTRCSKTSIQWLSHCPDILVRYIDHTYYLL